MIGIAGLTQGVESALSLLTLQSFLNYFMLLGYSISTDYCTDWTGSGCA